MMLLLLLLLLDAAAVNAVEARNLSDHNSEGRREEGGSLSSPSAPRSATHGSPLSPGWCGQWRVSGIVTGAESTSRQFGFEALRPLQSSRSNAGT